MPMGTELTMLCAREPLAQAQDWLLLCPAQALSRCAQLPSLLRSYHCWEPCTRATAAAACPGPPLQNSTLPAAPPATRSCVKAADTNTARLDTASAATLLMCAMRVEAAGSPALHEHPQKDRWRRVSKPDTSQGVAVSSAQAGVPLRAGKAAGRRLHLALHLQPAKRLRLCRGEAPLSLLHLQPLRQQDSRPKP